MPDGGARVEVGLIDGHKLSFEQFDLRATILEKRHGKNGRRHTQRGGA
jgi:hypothetical protein